MKANVYGLTESTITFNTIGMILRGKYSQNPEESNTCSVAYNINLENESQRNELMAIANLGLIHVDFIEEETVKETVVETPKEDLNSAKKEKQNSSRRKQAPKKADDKKVEEVPQPEEEITASDLQVPTESSEAVVMTENGPAIGKMAHKLNGEIDENDSRCKKAMDAAKALTEEEERLDDVIDDSRLDPSERMGSKAVIGTGKGEAVTVDMKNSIVGERNEPNFIDLGDEADDGISDDVQNAFIDDDSAEDLGDAFIEI